MKIKYEEWLNEKKRKEEIKLSVVKAEKAAKKLEEEKKYALSSSMIASTPFSFVKVMLCVLFPDVTWWPFSRQATFPGGSPMFCAMLRSCKTRIFRL